MQGEIVPPRNATTPIPQIVTSLAVVIRRARHDAGLTQAKLAAGAGISLRYVTLLEKGQYQASVTVLQNVANALGKPLWEMIREAEADLIQDPPEAAINRSGQAAACEGPSGMQS